MSINTNWRDWPSFEFYNFKKYKSFSNFLNEKEKVYFNTIPSSQEYYNYKNLEQEFIHYLFNSLNIPKTKFNNFQDLKICKHCKSNDVIAHHDNHETCNNCGEWQ